MIEGMSELLDSINSLSESIKPIVNFFKVITNPRLLLIYINSLSYWIAACVGIICILLVVVGHDKAKKWAATSFLFYVLIKALGAI